MERLLARTSLRKQWSLRLGLLIWARDWKKRLREGARGAELKQKLNDEYAPGRTGEYNPWWKFLDQPLRDWTTEESLILLYRQDEALDQIATALRRLAKAAEPFLDALS